MKNRIKSYSFWTALSGAVVIFLNALGDLCGFSVQDDLVSGLIMAVAGVLVVLGIVTMPSNEDTNVDDSANDDENTNDDKSAEKSQDNIQDDDKDVE